MSNAMTEEQWAAEFVRLVRLHDLPNLVDWFDDLDDRDATQQLMQSCWRDDYLAGLTPRQALHDQIAELALDPELRTSGDEPGVSFRCRGPRLGASPAAKGAPSWRGSHDTTIT